VRTLFLLLVLANVGFFAWRYAVEHLAPPATDPLGQQVHPERVRVLAPEALAQRALARRPVPCLELGPLAPAEVVRAEEAISAVAAGLKLTARKTEEPQRWWVYIGPLSSRAAAAQRVAELKKQGVEDSAVVVEDPAWRNAVSLGVFRSEEAAMRRLEELRRRGVRGAELGVRDAPGARLYLQLRDAPEPARLRLGELREGFPGAELRECP
jgi:hypothetical protein